MSGHNYSVIGRGAGGNECGRGSSGRKFRGRLLMLTEGTIRIHISGCKCRYCRYGWHRTRVWIAGLFRKMEQIPGCCSERA